MSEVPIPAPPPPEPTPPPPPASAQGDGDHGHVSLAWTVGGNVRVDAVDEDQLQIDIKFYGPWRLLSRDHKKRLLIEVIERLPVTDPDEPTEDIDAAPI
jgi:hypothetical protein